MMLLNAVASARRRYPVITDGLKLYLDAYNLDSYSGSGGTWTDLSNSNYNVTITGPTWTTSGGRRYFEFDGVNDYMIGSASTSIFDMNTSGFTWSFWIYYVTSPAVLDVVVFSEFVNTSGALVRYYVLDNRNTDAGSGTGAGYMIALFKAAPNVIDTRTTYAETVPTGSWFQLTGTFTYNSSTTGTLKIYKDGYEIVTEDHTITGTTWSAMNSFLKPVFGALSLNGALQRFNNIRLGEILQYNRPLTATEVNKNYNATKSNYGKSVNTNGLKLHLDAYNTESYSGSGSTWNDLSNSGYNMTIGGATWAASGGRRYFELDGVNDYIVGSADTTIFNLVDGWTWSMWVYWVTSPAVYDSIVQSEYASSKLPYFFDNRNNAGTSGAGFGGGMYSTTATGQGAAVNTTITTGAWTHVALTFKRNTATTASMVIYRNATALLTSSLTRSSGDWRDNNISKKPVIGAYLDGGTYSRFNNIRVGEVLNYNRELTSTEITDNYNATKSNYGL